MEKINTKLFRVLLIVVIPLFNGLMILLFVFLPVKFWNSSVRREAEDKKQKINKIWNFDLIDLV